MAYLRDDPEKEQNGEGDIKIEAPKSAFLVWLDNFWYHYKIPVVIIFFFAVLVIVCTAQMCSNRSYDTHILYAGPYQFTAKEKDAIEDDLSRYGKDINGDGAVLISLVNYQVASEEEIEASEGSISSSYSASQYQTYENYILTGDCSICLVSGYLYEGLKNHDRLIPLSDLLGKVPENAFDAFSVKLSDTDLRTRIKGWENLPEDTYLCVLRPGIIGASSKTSYFDAMREIYAQLID